MEGASSLSRLFPCFEATKLEKGWTHDSEVTSILPKTSRRQKQSVGHSRRKQKKRKMQTDLRLRRRRLRVADERGLVGVMNNIPRNGNEVGCVGEVQGSVVVCEEEERRGLTISGLDEGGGASEGCYVELTVLSVAEER